MKRLRSILFWCHLSAGVAAGIVILIMCATGAILSMKPQILNLVERDVRFVHAQQAPRLSPARLLDAVQLSQPGAQPMSLVESRDPSASVSIALAGSDTVYLDPYSGAVLGRGSSRAQAFFRSVEDWHRWLSVSMEHRAAARSITDASTLVFCGLAMSGLFLWWPRTWSRQRTKAIFWFRRASSPRARDFNWHHVIGFWSAPIMLVMTLSGIVMVYPWANNLLYRATGSAPPAPAGAGRGGGSVGGQPRNGRGSAPGQVPGNIDAIWMRAEQAVPTWGSINTRLAARGGPVTFSITDGAYWNSFARSSLTIDAKTAAVVSWDPYSGTSAGQKARGWMRFAHTGELGGWPAQIVAGLACLGGVMLVWTGLWLAARRLFAWRAARTRPRVQPRAA